MWEYHYNNYNGAMEDGNYLAHMNGFKYMNKYRGKNGKWVYEYAGENYDKGLRDRGVVGVAYLKTKGKPNSKYGTYKTANDKASNTDVTVNVRRSKNLFGGTTKIKTRNGGRTSWEITRDVGRIEQAGDSASKAANKAAKSASKTASSTVKSFKKQANKGRKFLSRLFNF